MQPEQQHLAPPANERPDGCGRDKQPDAQRADGPPTCEQDAERRRQVTARWRYAPPTD